jgi:hypothetical protein
MMHFIAHCFQMGILKLEFVSYNFYAVNSPSPGAAAKLLPCDMRSWVQVLEMTSCRNAGKGYIHKTQSGRIIPWTLPKRELCAPGCPNYRMLNKSRRQIYVMNYTWSTRVDVSLS